MKKEIKIALMLLLACISSSIFASGLTLRFVEMQYELAGGVDKIGLILQAIGAIGMMAFGGICYYSKKRKKD